MTEFIGNFCFSRLDTLYNNNNINYIVSLLCYGKEKKKKKKHRRSIAMSGYGLPRVDLVKRIPYGGGAHLEFRSPEQYGRENIVLTHTLPLCKWVCITLLSYTHSNMFNIPNWSLF